MSKQFDVLVYVGRFSPLHNGHVETIRQAATLAKNVVVFIGSSNAALSIKNPFSGHMRTNMVLESIGDIEDCRIHVDTIEDYPLDDTVWASQITGFISQHFDTKNIGIIGHHKDQSSYYLDIFGYELVEMPNVSGLNSTDIRDMYFGDLPIDYIQSVVPTNVYNMLLEFKDTPEYANLKAEYDYFKEYRKQYSLLEFPPVFVTADSVVFWNDSVWEDHVLLIERKFVPGKGLLALPGGFFNHNDPSVKHAAYRELIEETGIELTEKQFNDFTIGCKLFDSPNRSLRGRTITHTWNIELFGDEFPVVNPADDAAKACWVPLSQLHDIKDKLFDDHYYIIEHYANLRKWG